MLLIRERQKFQKSLQIGLSEFLELTEVCLFRCAVFGATGLGYIYIYIYMYITIPTDCAVEQDIFYILMYFYTKELETFHHHQREIMIPVLRIIQSFLQGLSGYFYFMALIVILKNIAILSPRTTPS